MGTATPFPVYTSSCVCGIPQMLQVISTMPHRAGSHQPSGHVQGLGHHKSRCWGLAHLQRGSLELGHLSTLCCLCLHRRRNLPQVPKPHHKYNLISTATFLLLPGLVSYCADFGRSIKPCRRAYQRLLRRCSVQRSAEAAAYRAPGPPRTIMSAKESLLRVPCPLPTLTSGPELDYADPGKVQVGTQDRAWKRAEMSTSDMTRLSDAETGASPDICGGYHPTKGPRGKHSVGSVASIAGKARRTATYTFKKLHISLNTTHGGRPELPVLLQRAGAELWEENGGWWRGGLARQA